MKVETPTQRAIRHAVEATALRIRAAADPTNFDGYRLVANAQSFLSAKALADVMADNDLDPDDNAEAAA
jgi:hypothetical protein